MLIIVIQVVYFVLKTNNFFSTTTAKEDKEWLLVQNEIDSLKKVSIEKSFEIKPFNPNFITDYKGYMLGMSVDEIDRLHKFRDTGKFINSAKEFKQVTAVSDELLHKMEPYFKFPDWVTSKKYFSSFQPYPKKPVEKIVPVDLNIATKEEIMKVYGIGDKISDIILKEKEKLGAFASIDQLQFVWGVSPEAFEDCKKRFYISPTQIVDKIKINDASTKELAKFAYFNYYFAKDIVTYRSMNGKIKSVEDLAKINNCPLEKLKIIALYLEF